MKLWGFLNDFGLIVNANIDGFEETIKKDNSL